MFIARLRRKSLIRRRKGERETLQDDAARFKNIVVSKTLEKGVEVPTRLLRDLQRATEQRDGGQRLYKLDLRRTHLTDAHVEALMEALQELPVVRKLDLRSNDAITVKSLHGLNSLLKGQVELFRLVQADSSMGDSSMSFLYSVKLDAAVLSLAPEGMEELEAQTAALELADSVLDVRHAFLQADIKESGALTEQELSGAMRVVVGVMPKPEEASRIMRFFGEQRAEGKEPVLISLGGFEAAMVGRLRDSHTLPTLPQGRDDILFGPAEDKNGQETSEFFSPWRTRSFGATTGGISGTGGRKKSQSSANQGFTRSSLGTQALPPWQGGEDNAGLTSTVKDDGGLNTASGGSRARDGAPSAYGVENRFDGDEDNSIELSPRTELGRNVRIGRSGDHTRGSVDGKATREEVGGGERQGRGVIGAFREGRPAVPAIAESTEKSGPTVQVDESSHKTEKSKFQPASERGGMGYSVGGITHPRSTAVGHANDDGVEQCLLTDNDTSSNDGWSSRSRQRRSETGSPKSSSRLQNKDLSFTREETATNGCADLSGQSDWRHHSSGTATNEGSEAVRRGTMPSSESDAVLHEGEDQHMEGTSRLAMAKDIEKVSISQDLNWFQKEREESLGGPIDPVFDQGSTGKYQKKYNRSEIRDCVDDQGLLSITLEQHTGGAVGVSTHIPPTVQNSATEINRSGKKSNGVSSDNITHAGTVRASFDSSKGGTGGGDCVQHLGTAPLSDEGTAYPPIQPLSKQSQAKYFEGEVPEVLRESRALIVGKLDESESMERPEGGPKEEGTVTPHFPTHELPVSPRDTVVGGSRGLAAETAKERLVQKMTSATAGVLAAAREVGSAKGTGPGRTMVSTVMAAIGTVAVDSQERPKPHNQHQALECEKAVVAASAAAEPKASPSELADDKVVTFSSGKCSGISPSVVERGAASILIEQGRMYGTTDNGAVQPSVLQMGTTQQETKVQVSIQKEDLNEHREMNRSGSVATNTAATRLSLDVIAEGSGEGVRGSNTGALSVSVPVVTTTSTLDCRVFMRKPYCLSPASVAAIARTKRVFSSTCREREHLAALIQLSVERDLAVTAAARIPGGLGLPIPPVDNSGSGGFSADLGGTYSNHTSGVETERVGFGGSVNVTSAIGSLASDYEQLSSMISPLPRHQPPERGQPNVKGFSTNTKPDGIGCDDSGGRSGCGGEVLAFTEEELMYRHYGRGALQSSRFYLPTSGTKTAPLCSAGGSTSLYGKAAFKADTSIGGPLLFSRCPEACSGRSEEPNEASKGKVGMGMERQKSPTGVVCPDEEESLVVQLDGGAFTLSRNGLVTMGIMLELEASHGYGRETLINLHTLVLSYNQLQVLDLSVLMAMPALQHLDVSHNILCRMEPMDGRNLPTRLESLNMSHNRISRIGGIGQCFHLRVVNLSHNRIKNVLGLEHLCFLEQLDLGYNFISRAASARSLSFNRSLKLLWLKGNPLARNPRYRPTLTCLLPHVRAIDGRSMPPNSDLDGQLNADLSENESENWGGMDGTAAHGNGRNKNGISRQLQEGQDERRVKEWDQVVTWRKEQARRGKGAEEQHTRDRHDVKQALNAAQQRQMVNELSRPRPRTRASDEAINKAKAIAYHKPAVVFGISYRQERDVDARSTMRIPTATDMPVSESKWQHRDLVASDRDLVGSGRSLSPLRRQSRGGDDTLNRKMRARSSSIANAIGFATDDNPAANISNGALLDYTPRRPRGNGIASKTEVAASPVLPMSGFSPPCNRRRSAAVVTGDKGIMPASTTVGCNLVSRSEQGTTVESERGDETSKGIVTEATENNKTERRGEDGTASDANGGGQLKDWLRGVKLETETAGTALEVLLKMSRGRGRCGSDGRRRQLAKFRNALEDMRLFSEPYGPAPMFIGDEGGGHANDVIAAARRVAMTKAAVKNMLRLIEEAEASDDNSLELEQYAEFVRQQKEIMNGIGGGERSDHSSKARKKEQVATKNETHFSLEVANGQADVGLLATGHLRAATTVAPCSTTSVASATNSEMGTDSIFVSASGMLGVQSSSIRHSVAGGNSGEGSGDRGSREHGEGFGKIKTTRIDLDKRTSAASTNGSKYLISASTGEGSSCSSFVVEKHDAAASERVCVSEEVPKTGQENTSPPAQSETKISTTSLSVLVDASTKYCISSGNKNNLTQEEKAKMESGKVSSRKKHVVASIDERSRTSEFQSTTPSKAKAFGGGDVETAKRRPLDITVNKRPKLPHAIELATSGGGLVSIQSDAGGGDDPIVETLTVSGLPGLKVDEVTAVIYRGVSIRSPRIDVSHQIASIEAREKVAIGSISSTEAFQTPENEVLWVDSVGPFAGGTAANTGSSSTAVMSFNSVMTPVEIKREAATESAIASSSGPFVSLEEPVFKSMGERSHLVEKIGVERAEIVPQNGPLHFDLIHAEERADESCGLTVASTGGGDRSLLTSVTPLRSSTTHLSSKERLLRHMRNVESSSSASYSSSSTSDTDNGVKKERPIDQDNKSETQKGWKERREKYQEADAAISIAREGEGGSEEVENVDGAGTHLVHDKAVKTVTTLPLSKKVKRSSEVVQHEGDERTREERWGGGGVGTVKNYVQEDADTSALGNVATTLLPMHSCIGKGKQQEPGEEFREEGVEGGEEREGEKIARKEDGEGGGEGREGADQEDEIVLVVHGVTSTSSIVHSKKRGGGRGCDEKKESAISIEIDKQALSQVSLGTSTSQVKEGASSIARTHGGDSAVSTEAGGDNHELVGCVSTTPDCGVTGESKTPVVTFFHPEKAGLSQRGGICKRAIETFTNQRDAEVNIMRGGEMTQHFAVDQSNPHISRGKDCTELTDRGSFKEGSEGGSTLPPAIAAKVGNMFKDDSSSRRDTDHDCTSDATSPNGMVEGDAKNTDSHPLETSTLLPLISESGTRKAAERARNVEISAPFATKVSFRTKIKEVIGRTNDAPGTTDLAAAGSSTDANESRISELLGEGARCNAVGGNKKDGGQRGEAEGEGEETKEGNYKTGVQNQAYSTVEDTMEPAWIEGYDPGHDCYYYHHVATGESSWYKPNEPYEEYVHSDEDDYNGELSNLREGDPGEDTPAASKDDRKRGTMTQGAGEIALSPRGNDNDKGSGNRRKKRREEAKRARKASTRHSPSRKTCILTEGDDREETRKKNHRREDGDVSGRNTNATIRKRSSKLTTEVGTAPGSRRHLSSRRYHHDTSFSSWPAHSSPSDSTSSTDHSHRESSSLGSRGDRRGARRRSEGRSSSAAGLQVTAVEGHSGRSQPRQKTALERLNDLTDENSGISEGLISDADGGVGGCERTGRGGEWRDEGSRRKNSEEQQRVSKRRSSEKGGEGGGRGKQRGGLSSRKGYHDGDENGKNDGACRSQKHSPLSSQKRRSNSLPSPEGSSSNKLEYQGRSYSGRKNSGGGSDNRRSSADAGGSRSKGTRER